MVLTMWLATTVLFRIRDGFRSSSRCSLASAFAAIV